MNFYLNIATSSWKIQTIYIQKVTLTVIPNAWCENVNYQPSFRCQSRLALWQANAAWNHFPFACASGCDERQSMQSTLARTRHRETKAFPLAHPSKRRRVENRIWRKLYWRTNDEQRNDDGVQKAVRFCATNFRLKVSPSNVKSAPNASWMCPAFETGAGQDAECGTIRSEEPGQI